MIEGIVIALLGTALWAAIPTHDLYKHRRAVRNTEMPITSLPPDDETLDALCARAEAALRSLN